MSSLTTGYADNEMDNAPPLLLLLLRLERELYALPLPSVREVMRYRDYTPVPGAPPMLPGIISQRGAILAVVEARALLGLGEAALTGAARLVVLQQGEIELALIVEQVFDLLEVSSSSVEPVPSGLDPVRAGLLRGLLQHEGQPIALLDLDALVGRLREDGER